MMDATPEPTFIITEYRSVDDGRYTVVKVSLPDFTVAELTVPTTVVKEPLLLTATIRRMLHSRQSTIDQLRPVED